MSQAWKIKEESSECIIEELLAGAQVAGYFSHKKQHAMIDYKF